MVLLIIVIFIIGYLGIAFEHVLKVNKAGTALITGVACWIVYALHNNNESSTINHLLHHTGEISSILFFLLGAMTIVEIIDSHNGFNLLIKKIKTRSKLKLLWMISLITFILSSVLDNLTTAILMTSLIGKVLPEKEDKLWFAGFIIIAANAGGAFSPLGDVTTTMLWIGNQISAVNIIKSVFLPSIFVCLVPLLIVSPRFYNKSFLYDLKNEQQSDEKEANLVLIIGMLLLLSVPVFKMVTHLPPFMGIILAVGFMWVLVTFIHSNKPQNQKERLTVDYALEKIDTPSILFFMGILLSVSALQEFGILRELSTFLNQKIGNLYVIGTLMGFFSALIDNVPLVAATQAMYDMALYPCDHYFWHLIALTTGTGGSMIIIGSAAGVAAMGIEEISFGWYLKKISWLALLGFLAGIIVFILQKDLF